MTWKCDHYLHTATIFDFIVFSLTLQLKLEPIKFARKLPPPVRACVVKETVCCRWLFVEIKFGNLVRTLCTAK